MNFIDLFAGIGGFRVALQRAGHNCIGFCEIDKYARQAYKANFNTEGEWEAHDITSVTDNEIRNILRKYGTVDLICGGFPCQAFSVAGKRRGFDDTRGTLFFEIARFAKLLKPRYLFLENVRGLLSHDRGRTFKTILTVLDELGYDAEWQVCNSKDYVPQNRERVFIIGHLRGGCTRKIFPFGRTTEQALIQVIPGKDACRVYAHQGIARTLKSEGGGVGAKTGLYLIDLSKKETKITEHARCLQARYSDGITNRGGERSGVLYYPISSPGIANKSQNGRRMKENGDPMFTLTIRDQHGVTIAQTPCGKNKDCSRCLKANKHDAGILDGMRIRKLTPLECFRLQGFSDDFFYKARAAGISNNQLYKQAGNSVTINVVYDIAKRL